MTDYFSTFGIDRCFHVNREHLEKRFHILQAASHPDRHISASAEDREAVLDKSSDINQAYRVLREPIPRAKHLLALLGFSAHEKKKVPQALLMDVMEAQEKIAELEATSDRPSQDRIKRELTSLSDGFAHHLTRLAGEMSLLTGEWDESQHTRNPEDLTDREKAMLSRLAEILAERSYVETLQHSVRAAEKGESAVVRH